MAGWISVDREMLDSKLFSRSGNHVKISIYLLLSANHKSRFHRGIEIKRGQCVRSFTQIEHACSVTRKAVRCAIENMVTDEFIEVEEPFGARKGHRITICNYDSYQSSEHREGQVGAKDDPSKVRSESHKQEGKREKNENKDIDFERVWILYQRKGTKQIAKRYWKKLSQADRDAIEAKIPAYFASQPEERYRNDFQGWINPANRKWENKIAGSEKPKQEGPSIADLNLV